jgi:hypothetical protein
LISHSFALALSVPLLVSLVLLLHLLLFTVQDDAESHLKLLNNVSSLYSIENLPLVLVIFGVLFGLVVVVNIALGHNMFSDSALGDATSTYIPWKQ